MAKQSEEIIDKSTSKASDKVSSGGFNPLAEPVQQREYTKDMIKANIGEIPKDYVESPIPEPTYERPQIVEESIGDDFSSQKQSAPSSSPKPESIGSTINEAPRQSINPPLDDLPDKEKKKAAKKTADALISTYARFVPIPFKKISSFNMGKMSRLDMEGEISLNMAVQEDGTTVKNYMDAINDQAEQVFVITPEMQEELKEPLIDLLMEQQLALTPTQRLLMAVGGHVVQMGVQTAQFAIQNKESLKTFKQFKADDDARGVRPATPQPQPQPSQKEQPKNEESYSAPTQSKETVKEESYDAPTFSIDEYMDDSIKEEEIATVDNGGIIVEEIN